MALFVAAAVSALDGVVTPNGDGIVIVVVVFFRDCHCCNDGHGSGSGHLSLFVFLLFCPLRAVSSSINTQASLSAKVECIKSIVNHHICSIGGIRDWWYWGMVINGFCNDWKQIANE